MVKMFSSDKPEIAGDYNLPHIDLINHKGEAIDLKFIFIELNLYESIYKNAVTGTLIITDAKNQIGRLEVQGLERIAFKLSSPGTKNIEDMLQRGENLDEVGQKSHAYSIFKNK